MRGTTAPHQPPQHVPPSRESPVVRRQGASTGQDPEDCGRRLERGGGMRALLAAAVAWTLVLALFEPAGVACTNDALRSVALGARTPLIPIVGWLRLRGGAGLRRSARMDSMHNVGEETRGEGADSSSWSVAESKDADPKEAEHSQDDDDWSSSASGANQRRRKEPSQSPMAEERPDSTAAPPRGSHAPRGSVPAGEAAARSSVPGGDAAGGEAEEGASFHGGLLGESVKAGVRRAGKEGKLLVVWVPNDSSAARASGGLLCDTQGPAGWRDPRMGVVLSAEVVALCVPPDTAQSQWLYEAHGQPDTLPALFAISPKGELLGMRSGGLDVRAVLQEVDLALAKMGGGAETARLLSGLTPARGA
ncbi:hypothetical protein T484DRAFT_1883318, partial [Baffinella frigidus]